MTEKQQVKREKVPFWYIWAAFFAWFSGWNLAGAGGALNALALFLVFLAFRWKLWSGLAALVAFSLIFILPYFMDHHSAKTQLARVKGLERDSAPIDLKGKIILFLEKGVPDHVLIQTLYEHTGALRLIYWNYDPHDLSQPTNRAIHELLVNKSIDLTDLGYHSLHKKFSSVTLSENADARIGRKLDFIITKGLTTAAEEKKLFQQLNDLPIDAPISDGRRYMKGRYDFRIIAPEDTHHFAISDENTLFSQVIVERAIAEFPYNPLSPVRFAPKYRFYPEGRITSRMLKTLCGAPSRSGYEQCTSLGLGQQPGFLKHYIWPDSNTPPDLSKR